MTVAVPDLGRWQGMAKMSLAELRALTSLVRPEADRVLEIGSLHGYSTVAFALAQARVTAVDMFQRDESRDDERCFDANLSAHGVGTRVEKLKGFSCSPEILAALRGRRFDVIFHDAEHRYRPVLRDILNLEPLLEVGGFFAFHDYIDKLDGQEWSLMEAVDLYFQGNPSYEFAGRTESLIVFRKLAPAARLRELALRARYLLRLPAPARREAYK